ncbi:penicillin-binding protein 2 [Nitrospira moscoviensis]|uniref:Penicillin-binding protein 2 n=1 Tax=Nitrospira moscoviensis TaxID=42253 RepID=A0A0K2G8K4_NITMO|nr:penicillin-binding protein 2 [Nitrospira moscoviensis]ALA57306.1 Penicillin-binding protein 2 [Nitrospira moscoviensis]
MAAGLYPEAELGELQRRLAILRVGLLLVVALLGLRLWHLQIREGPYYRDLSENNRTRLVLLEPARGLIYDRHGVLLANNVPSFSLYVTLEDVKDREALIQQLTDLLGLDPALIRKKLGGKGSKLLPRKIKDRLTLRDATVIESHRLDLPGVMIQVESQRNYPGGVTAAHLLGYVGEISAEQLEKPEFADLHQGSIVGQYGVEKSFDRHVRGQAGQKSVEVDALGHEKKAAVVEKPQAGNDLYLTIDVRLQKVAEDLLGDESGAIVALDPTNGDILAMASRPAFDPNVLSRELTAKQWVEIVQDEGRPLNNRASQGQYPPGSTFKVPMAVAALESKTMSPSSTVHCNGGYQFGKRLYHDWKAGGHGSVDLHTALVHSCDVYFYTVGQRMGIDVMAEFGKEFGLGQVTGIELPSERQGIMPSSAWKQKARNEPWLPGETISAAIGQGYVTVTPLQMASMIGTVANDGVNYRPRLVQAIMDRTTGNLQELPAVPRGKVSAKPETFRLIKEALADVVKVGTATRAKSSLVTIAGKTGTAQTAALRTGPEKDIPKKFRDHAWFVAFAPVDTPKIAVAVLAEHMGHGGSAAAPLAKEVIETYIRLAPQVPMVISDSSSAAPPRPSGQS